MFTRLGGVMCGVRRGGGATTLLTCSLAIEYAVLPRSVSTADESSVSLPSRLRTPCSNASQQESN